jgi:hypothetical protein
MDVSGIAASARNEGHVRERLPPNGERNDGTDSDASAAERVGDWDE